MKADAKKGKSNTVQNMDVSMEFRVRDRMGKFRYTFMPWQRIEVLEQIETLDAIEAELEGEADYSAWPTQMGWWLENRALRLGRGAGK